MIGGWIVKTTEQIRGYRKFAEEGDDGMEGNKPWFRARIARGAHSGFVKKMRVLRQRRARAYQRMRRMKIQR
jgi:hypothetical protein